MTMAQVFAYYHDTLDPGQGVNVEPSRVAGMLADAQQRHKGFEDYCLRMFR